MTEAVRYQLQALLFASLLAMCAWNLIPIIHPIKASDSHTVISAPSDASIHNR